MYVQDGPVVIPHAQPREAIVMPQDQAKYLSRAMVGKFTSQEVAKVFYTRNTFSFSVNPYDHILKQLGSKDHYGSCIKPSKFIEKLALSYHYEDPICLWEDDNDPEHGLYRPTKYSRMPGKTGLGWIILLGKSSACTSHTIWSLCWKSSTISNMSPSRYSLGRKSRGNREPSSTP